MISPPTLRLMPNDLEDEHSGAEPPAAQWDARYCESGRAIWSGRANGRLVIEVAGLTPGQALDIGCGEGADAIWLAQQGWTVTAIDVSSVAMSRAQQAARTAGVAVEWISGDVLTTSFPTSSFDLLSVQYPALRKVGQQAVRALLDCLCPGGVLLAVYHDLDEEHREHMKSRGIDPADYIGADDLRGMLGDDFIIEQYSVQQRFDPPPAAPHIADVVLRARRR
jgi:SAM-dependent methyltransferase